MKRMMSKIFRPVKLGGATALIALTSFLSYAIGLIRDRIIAVNFGTSSSTDIYNASFLIPDILFNLFIAGALSAAFMPVFCEFLVKDKKEAYKIANTVLIGGTILICFLAVIAFVFMPQLANVLFPEVDSEMQNNLITMTRIMLGSAILFAISNTLGNILMSFKHFFSYSISPILYNVGIILGVITLNDNFGIYSAAIGVLIGALLHAVVRIFDALRTDYKFSTEVDFKNPGFKRIIRLMIPKSISLVGWQINLYIFAIVGIKIIDGGLAAFHFARNIQSFAVSLFGVAFATAVFPFLADSHNQNDKKKYTEHIQKTIQRILFFTIPASVGIMLMSEPLIRLILSGGEFDENSVKITSSLLFFFGISIPFESLTHILSRAFYAIQNTITPTIINIISMIVIAFVTIFLAPVYGIKWFAIGFSAGFAIYAFILIIFLKKHLNGFSMRDFLLSFLKIVIATGIMSIIIMQLGPLEDYFGTRIGILLRIIISAGGFFVSAYLLKAKEMESLRFMVNRLLKKSTYET